MKKSELLKLRQLRATPGMMQIAGSDELKYRKVKLGYNGRGNKGYQYGLYLRCKIFGNILKVAIFFPEHMRSGGNLPVYEVFLDRQERKFLTYNCISKKWMTSKLNMIVWPDYVWYSEGKWINEQGSKTIKSFLGVEHGGYRGILEFQMQIRDEERKKRYRRETDPWDMVLEQTPSLPKDWNRWVNKVGIPHNYIFYQYVKRGAKTGYCTYCEKEVPINAPKHNQLGTCPKCRRKIQYKSVGKAGIVCTPRVDMYLLRRCEDGFMIREFQGYKKFPKGNYQNPEVSVWEIRRALCNHNAIPLSAFYWDDYKHFETRWIGTGFCHPGWRGDSIGMVYGKTLPDLANKELRKTGLVEYIRKNGAADPEKYLAVLRSVPQLEQLAKADLPFLAQECVDNYYTFSEIFKNPKSGNLGKLLGLDGQQLKRLRMANGGRAFVRWLQNEKALGREIPDHVIKGFCESGIVLGDIRFILDRMSIVQVYNYIHRQAKETGMKPKQVINTWADYLSMAVRLKMNTNDAIIYRVRKLRQRHDELEERCKAQDLEIRAGEVLQKYPHIEDIYDSIRPLYEYRGEDYSVVIPSKIEEIIREGEQLHHCVGSSERYWDRIERRESYVLFLRRISDLRKPYYTLEIEPDGTVRQKRTMYDRQEADIDLAKKFLREWQKEVSKKLTVQEHQLAVTSRVLREKEFEELKKERVIINTGEFWGKPLLDLLIADLMENSEAAAEPVLAAAA